MARDYVREQFTRKGYAVDWSIHAADPRGDSRNIHLHILVPLRKITGESFGNKARYDKSQLRQQVRIWRKSWATLANRHLKRYRPPVRGSNRYASFKDFKQEITQSPIKTTAHETDITDKNLFIMTIKVIVLD